MASATAEARRMISLRVRDSDLAQIDQHARKVGLTRTDYMIRAALGEPFTLGGVEERLDSLEQRFSRLEELRFLDS